MRHAASCADNMHCCPGDMPVCDTQQGMCTSEDGTKSAPWVPKTTAVLAEGVTEQQLAEAAAAEAYERAHSLFRGLTLRQEGGAKGGSERVAEQ